MISGPEKWKDSVIQEGASPRGKLKGNGEQLTATSPRTDQLLQGDSSDLERDAERERERPGKPSARMELGGRQNSLRHVKDSTEMLRQRPTKRVFKDGISDANAAMREGTNFTVANVGNNGKIYLRCVEETPSPAWWLMRPHAEGK